MDASCQQLSPERWLRWGKYLFPVGLPHREWRRNKPASKQVRVASLATQHPDQVRLITPGKTELLPEYRYDSYTDGVCEEQVLPAQAAYAPFVAEIKNGVSFGRHCCVIGPEGKAVRETGFNLDGEVLSERTPVNRMRLKYWRKRWEGDVTSRPWLPAKQRVEGRVAVLNTRFSHNYYHWLIDILPRLSPLRRSGLEADLYLVDSLSGFQRNVFERLGIKSRQLIQPHCRMLVEAETLLAPSMPTPACLRGAREMLVDALGVSRRSGGRRLHISRRNAGTRRLANEQGLLNLLSDWGFETHAMETYPIEEQARLIRESETIVALHGAGLANLIFARPGTQVIEIVPAGRYNATIYPEKSRVFGLRHQVVFAQRARHKQILSVSLDDVSAALEQAHYSLSHRAAA